MADERKNKAGRDSWEPGIRHAFRKARILGRGEQPEAPEDLSENDLEWLEPEPDSVSRYEIHDELARDSASILHLARDREVDRDVTLRVQGGDGNGDETSVRRFLEEAQVGAQLQHPGILPVYGLGVLEDGRAYVASRVVEGEPLAQLQERGETGERLLGILEQAAHALAYAHARGVAHGALDANRIHVGAHGEVVISGWERAVRASWDARRIDADVRALLDLLGKVLGKSVSGKLASAGAVARAIGKHLAGREARVREAEVAAATARVDAERERVRAVRFERQAVRERAARQRTLGLAAAVLLALSLGFGGYFWREGEEVAEQDRVGAQVIRALREAKRHETAGDWAEARAWARKAVALARETGSGLHPEAEDLVTRLEESVLMAHEDEVLLARLEEIRLDRLHRAGDPTEHRTAAFRAFREIGLELPPVDPEETAAIIRDRTRPLEIAAELDFFFTYRGDSGDTALLATACLVDPDPWRRVMRRAIGERDFEKVRPLAAAADVSRLSPRSLFLLVWTLLWLAEDLPLTVRVCEEALLRTPGDDPLYITLIKALEGLAAGLERPFGDGTHLPRTYVPSHAAKSARHRAVDLAQRPRDARTWGFQGYALALAGEPDRARAAIRRSLDLEPDSPATLLTAVRSLSFTGDFSDAVACARRAVSLDPRSGLAHSTLGVVLLNHTSDYEGAARAYREAIRLGKKEPHVYGGLAKALERAEKVTEAAVAAAEAVEAVPDSDPIAELLARARAQALAGEREGAIETLRRLLRLDPEHHDALHDLASHLLDLKRGREAIPVLRKAISTARPHSGCTARLYPPLAQALMTARRFDEALAASDAWIRISPGDAFAHMYRGIALEFMGSAADALTAYGKAASLAGDDFDCNARFGSMLVKQGRTREAIEVLEKTLKLEMVVAGQPAPPIRVAWIWLDLGAAYVAEKRVEDGISAYRKAIEVSPGSPAAAGAHGNLGQELCRAGRVREGIAEYRRAIEIDPELPSSLNLLAWLLATGPDVSLRDPEAAVKLAQRAVRATPAATRWAVQNTLGVALYRAGRFEEAIEPLTASLRVAPQIGAYSGLFIAMAHFRLGRRREAREWYEKSIRWMEQNPTTDEELRRFRSEAEELIGKRQR